MRGMDRSFEEISDECRQLVRELVNRIVELEANGAEWPPIEVGDRRFKVRVDELDANGEPL